MPGPVPGIHVLRASWISVDGRDKPGHDAVEVLAPDLSAQMRWLRPQTAPPIRDQGARTPGDYRAAWLTFH
ncbi:hypothetical protein ABIF65_009989 [Bradyrhizobium japonicum]|jgi:hypothetical protein|nr:hypothetical protein [Bradyrhizobium japonicum]MCP1783815.1 hypothetical protein [Bradyrhizobium japonicum]MCP1864713.1 hypothetical protein [Bradyrhizobium japonicum]MCP1896513.1 hypothetical protein [Bradyrhizobium japonicum]MCP1963896.1 hypothetical protein [Bradyrhizobium japonicum]